MDPLSDPSVGPTGKPTIPAGEPTIPVGDNDVMSVLPPPRGSSVARLLPGTVHVTVSPPS